MITTNFLETTVISSARYTLLVLWPAQTPPFLRKSEALAPSRSRRRAPRAIDSEPEGQKLAFYSSTCMIKENPIHESSRDAHNPHAHAGHRRGLPRKASQ